MSTGSIIFFAFGFVALLVLSQSIHIFPGAFLSKFKLLFQGEKSLPYRVSSSYIPSLDNTSLEVWKYEPEEQTDLSKYRAIVFHGNGGSLENFVYYQMWFAELGIPSYSFDYRGYGRSSGWPSEKGIYLDGDAVWKHVINEEQIDASKVIVVGISVGSGPAARAAALYAPRLLLLSSAFTDLKSAVRAQPVVGLLWPFIWYSFPTNTHVQQLQKTDLILVHGKKDKVVPSAHSVELEKSYRGSGRVSRLESETAGHNMAFYDLKDELKTKVSEYLSADLEET